MSGMRGYIPSEGMGYIFSMRDVFNEGEGYSQ